MMTSEEVYNKIESRQMTPAQFYDWVSDVRSDAYVNGTIDEGFLLRGNDGFEHLNGEFVDGWSSNNFG